MMEDKNWGGMWDESRTSADSTPEMKDLSEERTGQAEDVQKVPVNFSNARGNGTEAGNGGMANQYAQSPTGAWQNQPYQNPPRPNQGYPGNGYGTPNPYPYQASPYQGAPQMPEGFVGGGEEPVKVSEWILTLVLLSIPCVNLIMLFVWGFSSTEKKSKANFCKASLIWAGIVFAIVFMIYIVVAAGIIAGLS